MEALLSEIVFLKGYYQCNQEPNAAVVNPALTAPPAGGYCQTEIIASGVVSGKRLHTFLPEQVE